MLKRKERREESVGKKVATGRGNKASGNSGGGS